MRERLLPRRPRPMARRPGEGGRVPLSPRARQLAGWLVALLIVLGIAGAVRLFGESADDGALAPSPSGGGGAALLPIVFGTELTEERVVPVESRTATFERGGTFAYAVDGGEPAEVVYVEVQRTDGGTIETVQEPEDPQAIPDAPALIGFTVPTEILLDAWGPGAYLMRIYLDPDGAPIAEGSFVLVETAPTP